MKLKDLFESFQTDENEDFLKYRGDEIGRGAFATVYSTEKGHQTAVRSIDYHTDYAYSYWVKNLIERKLRQKNPHFPKFFNINIDPKTDIIIDAEMERLTPGHDLTSDQLDLLFFDVYGDKVPPDKRLLKDINDQCKTGNSRIQNKLLIEACKITTDLYKLRRDELIWDLHGDNIMARIYKYGIQLVITDPFAPVLEKLKKNLIIKN